MRLGQSVLFCVLCVSLSVSVPGHWYQGGVTYTHLSLCACWEYIPSLSPG